MPLPIYICCNRSNYQFRGVSLGSNIMFLKTQVRFFVCMFVFLFLSQSLDQLIENTVPSSIRMNRSMKMDDPVCKLTLRVFKTPPFTQPDQPFDESK